MSHIAKPSIAATPCPCGQTDVRKKPLAYADCCGRFIEAFDTSPAPDAQSLMRSGAGDVSKASMKRPQQSA